MNKALKYSLIALATFIVVIVVALMLIPMFVDIQKYKPQAEEFVSQKTGRAFSIGDDLRLSLFPWASLSFSDLQLGNPSGFEEEHFATIKAFEIRIKLLPLLVSFGKNVQVQRFIVKDPTIYLVKNKNGRVNWQMGDKAAAVPPTQKDDSSGQSAGAGIPLENLVVGDFAIKNGLAVYIDHGAGSRMEVSELNLAMQDVSLDRPIDVRFSAKLDDKPLSLEGTLGPVGKSLEGGTMPLDINLQALQQLDVTLKGNVENPLGSPGFDVALTVDPFSPKSLMAALGQKFPIQTSDPKALDRLGLSAKVKGNASAVTVSDGQLDFDDSKINFSLKAADFSRPNLGFKLDLDQIDVDRYLPPESDRPAKKSGQGSKAPAAKKKTDYGPLRRLILDGEINIGKLVVKKATVQEVLLKVKAKDGIIKLDPFQLLLYQGQAAGQGRLNVTKDVPLSNFSMQLKEVQINPLLQDVMQKDIIEGQTNAVIELAMRGDDPDRIKKTLSGKGSLNFNDGAIVGIDLADMARNVKSAFGLAEKTEKKPRTDFTELSVPFKLDKGVFVTQNTSLQSPFLRLIAAGNADLVKETLDFRVEPKAVATLKGQGDKEARKGVLVPVNVSGSFSAPKFKPDLKEVAKQQLQDQVLESGELDKALGEDNKELKEAAEGMLKGIINQ